MKYAVFSDVHSNVFALKAALEEIDRIRPDKIICLGDIVGNGFYPEETVSLIRRRGDIICVKGNHDMFVTMDLRNFSKEDSRVKMFMWQQKAISSASVAFLAGLPQTVKFKDGAFDITAFHYPANQNGRFKNMKYLPTRADFEYLFGNEKGNVFLFGHEHTGSLDEINGRYFLNFGTLGNFLQKDTARFGLVEINGRKLVYKPINVYYDDSSARKTTEKLNEILSGDK